MESSSVVEPFAQGRGGQPSPVLWVGIGAALMFVEYLTGPAIHLAVWYMLPIGLAAWYHGWRWAVPIAVSMPLIRFSFFLTGLWESLTGTLHAPAGNAVSRIGALSLLAAIVSHLGRQSREASRQVQQLQRIQRKLDSELETLERRADSASPHAQAQMLNRAGDLCNLAGDQSRAENYYGRAIDTYLDLGEYDRAGVLCRKLLRVKPEVVRAHATLALIAIGKRSFSEAEHHLADYVRAVNSPEQEQLAAAHLRLMAEIVEEKSTLDAIGGHMWRFGYPEVVPALMQQRKRASAAPELSAASADEARWRHLVRLAQLGPVELRRAGVRVHSNRGA